jgi:hypothetical protein
MSNEAEDAVIRWRSAVLAHEDAQNRWYEATKTNEPVVGPLYEIKRQYETIMDGALAELALLADQLIRNR